MRARVVAALTLAGVAGLAACDHVQPFGPPDLGPNQPFSTTLPRQLTFSPLGDVQPAWLPGGTGIIYSQSLGGPDGDHCLAILPPEGGHITQTICHTPTLDADSTNALWLPAVSPSGFLAYVRESSPVGSVTPTSIELVLASLSAPEPGRVLQRVPYTAPDGTLQTGLRDLHWFHDGSLVYRAGVLTYSYPPYPWDTTFAPIEIVRLDLVGDSSRITVVPGTSNATSLATDSAAALYYTLPGDSRVYRLAEGAPAATVWYDFGAAGVPTQIQVAGKVLVGLVGDSLYDVHVGSGSPVVLTLPDSMQVANLALAATGDRLVVEGRARGNPPDLWLLEVP